MTVNMGPVTGGPDLPGLLSTFARDQMPRAIKGAVRDMIRSGEMERALDWHKLSRSERGERLRSVVEVPKRPGLDAASADEVLEVRPADSHRPAGRA